MKYKVHLEQLHLEDLKSIREKVWQKKIKENFNADDLVIGKYSDLNILAIYSPKKRRVYFNQNRFHFEVDEALSKYDASNLPQDCITIFVQSKTRGLKNDYAYEVFSDFSAEYEIV